MPCRYLRQSSGQDHTVIRGPPLDIGGGGGGGGGLELLPGHFYLVHKGDGKLFFSPQDRPYFHQALWTCIYFTHFPHKNIYFQKTPPPSILMVAP